MIEVLESVELLAVALMTIVAMWLIDFIQRRTGHPLDDIPDE